MKYFVLFLCSCFIQTAQAQHLTFCESVSANGTPKNESTIFQIGKKGGYLTAVIHLPGESDTHYVILDLYKTDPLTKKEKLDNSIRLETEPGWTWFSKKILFHQAGEYIVYAYSDKDQFLSVGKIKIVLR